MPSCIVKGCNFSWKKKDPNIILHSFPGDLGAIKSWMLATTEATKQEIHNMDELCQKILVGKAKGLYRMCSQHFTGDCYYQRGMLISLKKDALPTKFPDKETIELKALRPKTYKPRKKRSPPPYPALVDVGGAGVPTSMVMGLPLRVMKLEQDAPVPLSNPCYISEHGHYVNHGDVYGQRRTWNAGRNIGGNGRGEVLLPPKKTRTLGTNTEYFLGQRHKITLTDKNTGMRHKEVQMENGKDGRRPCQCSQDQSRLFSCLHVGERTGSSATITPTNYRTLQLPQSGIGLPSDSPVIPKASVRDAGCSYSLSAIKEKNSVLGDPNTEQNPRQGNICSSVKQEYGVNKGPPGELGIKSEDLARVEIPGTSSDSENKYVVFDSCLNKLLMCCRCLADDNCNGSIVKFEKFFLGSRLSVKAECSNGHRFHMWDSQPL